MTSGLRNNHWPLTDAAWLHIWPPGSCRMNQCVCVRRLGLSVAPLGSVVCSSLPNQCPEANNMNWTTDLWNVFPWLRGHVESCRTFFFPLKIIIIIKKKPLTIHLSQFMLRWWEQNRQSHIPTQETQPLELYGAQPFYDAGLNLGITGAIDSHMSRRPWKKHSYTAKVSENMLTDTVC